MYQYQKKPTSHPRCPVSGAILNGLPQRRPAELSNKRLSKKNKTVNRVYGGHLSHGVVRERIIRAFLIEEQKIVKKVTVGCSDGCRRRGVCHSWIILYLLSYNLR